MLEKANGNMIYYKFSGYLKKKYGTRVYKLPVCIPATCPNRDGLLSSGGCIFCGGEGAGFEGLSDKLSVREQLLQNAAYIGNNYNSKKFIAFFQNYSNTYMPLDKFKEYINDACIDNIVAIYIATRPDCISNSYLEFLREIKREKDLDIVLEIGLQTANYKTLKWLNRGHGLAEFIDAVIRIKKYGLECCAHCIVDIPKDDIADVVETARILSALGVEQVKCHSMYILKDTVLGDMFEKGEIAPLSMEEYIERSIAFLEHLDPGIAVQRLIGRAPSERTLFCNWGTSWWKIHEAVESEMRQKSTFQGRLLGRF